MKIALLIVFAVGVVAYAVLGLRKKLHISEPGEPGGSGEGAAEGKDCSGSEGCGVSCLCGDQAMALQMSDEIVYYDDEELDAYKGVAADGYSDSQVEEFSEVLTTLQPGEVSEWLHSLQLRGVNLPEQLKDEAAMMME
jgi:hypothetical protein